MNWIQALMIHSIDDSTQKNYFQPLLILCPRQESSPANKLRIVLRRNKYLLKLFILIRNIMIVKNLKTDSISIFGKICFMMFNFSQWILKQFLHNFDRMDATIKVIRLF